MTRRTKRQDAPWHPERHLVEMKKARATLCSMRAEIVIDSDLYKAAGACIDAIDDVAKELTGDDRHFTPVLKY